MNRYPLWKYILVVISILVACLYTIPNFFGETPAVQVSTNRQSLNVESLQAPVSQALQANGISHTVLAYHIVKRRVAASVDDLGKIFTIGAKARDKGVDGDVLLGEDVLVGEQPVESTCQLVVTGIGKKMACLYCGTVIRFYLFVFCRHLPAPTPRIESKEAKPDICTDKKEVADKLNPDVVGIEVDGQENKYESGYPFDDVGETNREVIAVGISFLIGTLHGTLDAQSHTYVDCKIDCEQNTYSPNKPKTPSVGESDNSHGLKEHRQQYCHSGKDNPIVLQWMFFFGKEIAFAHKEHLQ